MQAAPVVATQISLVTVYRNGALVARTGRARGDVEVRGLPLLFASDTLRVRPDSGGVRSLEETVRLESTPAPLPPDESARAAVLLEIARVDDALRTCGVVLELLDSLAPELPDPRAPAEKLVDAALFLDLVGFAGARAEDVVARRALLEKERRALDVQRRKIDERAGAVPTEAPRVLRGARFTLDGDAEVPFTLEYFVPAARWVPTYALQLTGKNARLVTAALVAQASGEDWGNARVAVCTADLSRETTLPTLSSWRMGRAQPSALRAFRPLPTDLPSLFYGYDRAPRRAAPPPPKGGPAPAPPPPPPQSRQEFDRLESGELRSFEKETTRETPMYKKSADMLSRDDDDSAEGGELDEPMMANGAPAMAAPSAPFERASTKTGAMMPMADMARPAPMQAPSRSRGMMAPGAPPSFGGGGGRRDEESGVVRAQAELPPRWRTAYMRMAGPDEHQRGSLLPLDPTARLEWLLEAHDIDGGGRAELWRAIQALQQAQARLDHQPLPRGTSALLGTHFPSVMQAATATDIPGDGTFYRVEVRVDEGPAAYEHRGVPRESNDVWRTCRVDVKGAPLPAGPLAVYENGAFKVNARLDGTGGGKPLDVNLGVDPDVRIVARTAHVNQSEKGLVTSTSRVEHKVKIELRSTRPDPANVVLYDRLPTPADNVKDVTVNVIEEKPPLKRTHKDAHGNDVIGAFEWRVTVMPGDTQAIALTYAIDLPAKTELEGGNRRE